MAKCDVAGSDDDGWSSPDQAADEPTHEEKKAPMPQKSLFGASHQPAPPSAQSVSTS